MKFLLSIFATASVLTIEVAFAERWRQQNDLTMQEKALLDAHNDFRSATALGNTGSQPMAMDMTELTWDDEIAAGAKDYAEQCIDAHDQSNKYGENLWSTASTEAGLDTVDNMIEGVRNWYDEHEDFTYENLACPESKVCGHYTQAVWANSLNVGCGYAMCKNIYDASMPYQMMIVCRYSPAGNVIGDFPYTEASNQGYIATGCPPGYTGNSQTGLCETSDAL